MYSLSAGTFEQVVDARGDEQHVALLLQVYKALVGIDHLLQIDILWCHMGERVLGILVDVELVEFVKRHLVLDHDGAEDTASEVTTIGDEVDI